MSTKRATPATPGKELARQLNALGYRYPIDSVFRDWVEASALAVANACDRAQFAAREERYLAIVGKYQKSEVHEFCHMYANLALELERTGQCVFGPLIADLELGTNKRRMGQYLTPWNVSYMMAKILLDGKDLEKKIAEQGYITMMEPACGAGSMVLAAARAMEDEGINYQQHLHVTAIDIDPLCVQMTFLQASLFGLPAHVIQGDSLRNTQTAHWFTPFHMLWGWDHRLAWRDRLTSDAAPLAEQLTGDPPPEPAAEAVLPPPQDVTSSAHKAAVALRKLRAWDITIRPGENPPY